MSTLQTLPLPALGVDVLAHDTALPAGAVRDALNVDIDRSGAFGRRTGYQQRLPATGLHSLWHAPQRGWTLLAQGAMLKRLEPDAMTTSDVFALGSIDPLSFVEYNGGIYFGNRATLGFIPPESEEARAVGVPTPYMPALVAGAGSLGKGHYAAALTFIDERGEESGATTVQTIHLDGEGSIVLSLLPQRLGWDIAVYLSDTNGEVLRRAVRFPAVFPSYTVGGRAAGAVCATQHLSPLAPGEFVRALAGRLYTARGSVLRFSEALRPHLHDPAQGVIPFVGRITLLEAVAGGLYVGDSRGVWFLEGQEPGQFQQRLASPQRAVMRSGMLLAPEHFDGQRVQSGQPVALWLSAAGYMAGLPGGSVVELQSSRLRLPAGLVGRSALVLQDGRRQVVTLADGAALPAPGIARDAGGV